MSRPNEFDPRKIYCGGCPNTSEEDLERLFSKHGTVERVWVAKSPPGFAFLWMSDDRDAADAVKALDGFVLSEDQTLVVAIAKGPRGHDRDGVDRARREAPRDNYDRRDDYDRAPPPRRMDGPPKRRPKGPGGFRVRVANLPPHVDWRDLKDGFRKSGDVSYANANGDEGVVEFSSEEDRQRCVQDFDESVFMGNTIRVESCGGSTREFFAKTAGGYNPRFDKSRAAARERSPPRRDYDDYDRRPPPRDDYRRDDYRGRSPPRRDYDRGGYDRGYDRGPPPRDDYRRDDRDYRRDDYDRGYDRRDDYRDSRGGGYGGGRDDYRDDRGPPRDDYQDDRRGRSRSRERY